ncbi:MAG: hypothetical protein ACUZ8O_01275 [Candidatus Anammoxibacter sp.]
MKKLKFYIEKIMNYCTHWKDYLPITNMALFGTVVILSGIIIGLFFLPILLLKPGKLDKKTLIDVDKTLLVSRKYISPDVNQFDSIGNKNIFRSSRTDWNVSTPIVPIPEKEEKKIVKKKKTPKPKVKPEKIKLSAIVVFGDTRVALVENMDKSKNKDKFIYVKEGEDLAGYTVKSIERDKLIVEWNGEESIIMLYKF